MKRLKLSPEEILISKLTATRITLQVVTETLGEDIKEIQPILETLEEATNYIRHTLPGYGSSAWKDSTVMPPTEMDGWPTAGKFCGHVIGRTVDDEFDIVPWQDVQQHPGYYRYWFKLP